MGNEVRCRVEIDGIPNDGVKVLLESDEVILRGPVRMRVPFATAAAIAASDGILDLHSTGVALRLHIGRNAARWAETIRNPKSVAARIGIRPGLRVSITGSIDDGFVAEMEAGGADISRRLRKDSDIVFVGASGRSDLQKLTKAKSAIRSDGAVWVIRPKGSEKIRESDVMTAAKGAGLVDVKVVRVSDTHTAEKLVIPLALR